MGHINQSTDFSGNSTWIMAGENSVKLYDGQSYTDIDIPQERQPRFANLDPTKWSSCQIGQVVYLNHPNCIQSTGGRSGRPGTTGVAVAYRRGDVGDVGNS